MRKKHKQTHGNPRASRRSSIFREREGDYHAHLQGTLRAWARIHQAGVSGKERIVLKYANRDPSTSTSQDDFVGRVLWAVSDLSGLPAKRFADLNPVPLLEWLKFFSEQRYRHADLERFGVRPETTVNDKLFFSLMHRPSPYPLAPWMSVTDFAEALDTEWDSVMNHMARWLVRHLDDPTLLLWVVEHGARLHCGLVRLIESNLNELAVRDSDRDCAEFDRIRANAPKAIPRAAMRTLWRLLLTGRVRSGARDLELFRWLGPFKLEGLTVPLRLKLREMLTPRISLHAPLQQPSEGDESCEPESIRDVVECEIALSTNHVHSVLRELSKDKSWTLALPDMLSDFSQLLRDALDLMRVLGDANDKNDLSYIHQPSISEHPQNSDFHDWTALIELTRDAWLAKARQSSSEAALAAESWWTVPYPLFRRLAFFAAAKEGVSPHRALDWLLADKHWWLWSIETKRETIRLLVALASRLDKTLLQELELAVLAGPPREIFRDDIAPERRTLIENRETWLRLAKMQQAGDVLGPRGKKRLAQLSVDYSQWQLAADQSDEFPYWAGDDGDLPKIVTLPRRRRELIEWLRQHPVTEHWREDGHWPKLCRNRFATTACALCALAKEGVWPSSRWNAALQSWSEAKHLKRSWRYITPVLNSAPDEVLKDIAYGVSSWLWAIARILEGHESNFRTLACRILALDHGEDSIDIVKNDQLIRAEHPDGEDSIDIVRYDQLIRAQHPVGMVTQALLRWTYRRHLEDGEGLPQEVRDTFAEAV